MECEKTVFQDEKLQMEGGGWPGQSGCRKEEEENTEMEEPGWTEASDEQLGPMEDFDKSRCVLGTAVEGWPDRAWGPLSMEFHHRLPTSFPAHLTTGFRCFPPSSQDLRGYSQ